jgi:acyl dehydratase
VGQTVPDTKTITTIEELRAYVGREIRVGEWRELTQDDVSAFGQLSGENSWIHSDSVRAQQSSFGGTIAQGTLALAMAPGLLEHGTGVDVALQVRYGLNYGFNRIRFMNPIRVGQRIRARLSLVSITDVSPNVYQIEWLRTIDIEGEAKPAMVAEALSRQYV